MVTRCPQPECPERRSHDADLAELPGRDEQRLQSWCIDAVVIREQEIHNVLMKPGEGVCPPLPSTILQWLHA